MVCEHVGILHDQALGLREIQLGPPSIRSHEQDPEEAVRTGLAGKYRLFAPVAYD